MKLEQITETINKINELTKDIEQLDKQVRLCSEGETKVELGLIFTDIKAKVKAEAEEIVGDNDNKPGLIQTSFGSMISFSGGQFGITNSTPSYESEYVTELSDSESIEMLGLIINKKKVQKEKLIKKLVRAGIKIN